MQCRMRLLQILYWLQIQPLLSAIELNYWIELNFERLWGLINMIHNDFANFARDTSSILMAWIIASCIAAQHGQGSWV